MAQTHDLGPFFAYLHDYQTTKAPFVNPVSTQEIEPPFKTGKALIFRLPRQRRGLVLGVWWSRHKSEVDALLGALGGRELFTDAQVGELLRTKDDQ